jgi:hypothetical protein
MEYKLTRLQDVDGKINYKIEPINEFNFVLISWDYDELYKYASKLNIGESKIIRI